MLYRLMTRRAALCAVLLASLAACDDDPSEPDAASNLPDGVLWQVTTSGADSASYSGNIYSLGSAGELRIIGFGDGAFSLVLTEGVEAGATGTFELGASVTIDGARYATEGPDGSGAPVTVTIDGWAEKGLPPELTPFGRIGGSLSFVDGAAANLALEIDATFDLTASPF